MIREFWLERRVSRKPLAGGGGLAGNWGWPWGGGGGGGGGSAIQFVGGGDPFTLSPPPETSGCAYMLAAVL